MGGERRGESHFLSSATIAAGEVEACPDPAKLGPSWADSGWLQGGLDSSWGRKGRPTSVPSAAVCGHHRGPAGSPALLQGPVLPPACLRSPRDCGGTRAQEHRAQIVSVFKEIVLQSTIAELTKVFSVGSTSLSFISFPFLSLLFFPPNMK